MIPSRRLYEYFCQAPLACHHKVDSLEVSLEARLLNATSEVIEHDFCK
jgi:hypothetical protein